MRTSLALSALVALAHAMPQGINFNAVNEAPAATILGPPAAAVQQTAVYNGDAAASSAGAAAATNPPSQKRALPLEIRQSDPNQPCAPQPDGYGPVAQPNTVAGFQSYPPFRAFAYGTPPPPGYTRSFANLNGSTQMPTYMGLYTLKTYNATQCTQFCDSTTGCQAVNLYFERDPTLNPAPACPNPTAFTNIKCTLWGSPVTAASATNTGQYRDEFQVVIAGSDGFNKQAPFSPGVFGFAAPSLYTAAIDYSASYIGSEFYYGPYNPAVCGAVCQSTTASNKAVAAGAGQSSYAPCNYFNSYILSQGGIPQGTYCSFYSAPVGSSYATTKTVQGANGASYTVVDSLGYAALQQASGNFS